MRKKIGGESAPIMAGDTIVCEILYKKFNLSIRRGGKLFFEDTNTTDKIIADGALQGFIKKICIDNNFNAQMVKDDNFEKIWILQNGEGIVKNTVITGTTDRALNAHDCPWIVGEMKAGTKVYLYYADGGDGTNNGKARVSLKPNLPTVYEIHPSLINWD